MQVRQGQVAETEVEALLARSNRLGRDRKVTNFGGGNTSCKAYVSDPVTGEEVCVMWVKGSGGDLATLRPEGLAALRVDRVRALRGIYRGVEHQDELVARLDHCRFGADGTPPSIEAPLHALLPAAHVDHVHPDAVIALAIAADGQALVERCYSGEVGWIEWTRPGFALAVRATDLVEAGGLRGIVLGGHGLLSWGDTSEACEATTRELIERAEQFLADNGRTAPFGAVVRERSALPPDERRARATALAPALRGLCSTDGPVVGRFSDSPEVLELLASEEAPRIASLGTSCPDHYLRTKILPLLLDLPAAAPLDEQVARLRVLHAAYRETYAGYYARYADATSPAMRGADPKVVLLPGIGMWSFGPGASQARVAGEFYANAINAIRGAETVSRYEPIDDAERFGIEYWWLEEAKLQRLPRPKPLAGKVALVTGGASGIGKAIAERLAAEGAAVIVADISGDGAAGVADALGGPDHAVPAMVDVADETEVCRAFEAACLAFGGVDIVVQSAGVSLSAPLLETTAADWDRQHAILARGSFLVSRQAARTLIAQGRGGDIVYVVSKNAVVAGPGNIAYASAKADQAHQVRLLAVELGEHGIRVNGVNPDGVVEGSGIFAGEWGDRRAELHGVPREELGRYYASRTLLEQEVLPSHVAGAVFALVGSDLRRTTGTIVPVDGGVSAGFLR